MTLKRLFIILGILVVLAGAGIAWLWQYAYSPQGRARVIIAQLKGDTTSWRGWMLQHHVILPGFSEPPQDTSSRASKTNTMPSTFQSYLDDINRKFRTSDARRIAAADEMVKLGPAVRPLVLDSLRDGNPDMQLMAIRACGKFRDPDAIKPLVKCLLEAIPDPNPLPNSFTMEGKNDYAVLCWCRDSLLEIGPEGYGPFIEATTKWDRSMLREIPEALAEKWGAAAIPHLIEFLDNKEPSVRASAAVYLGQFKDQRATDALIRHLGDNTGWAVECLAGALAEIGDAKSMAPLLRMVKDQKEEKTKRILVAGVLAGKGRDEGIKFLVPLLKSHDPYDRAFAADKLGGSHNNVVMIPLLILLTDKNSAVRAEAVRSLGELHDPRAIQAVNKLLNDSDPRVRHYALEALHELHAKPQPNSQPTHP